MWVPQLVTYVHSFIVAHCNMNSKLNFVLVTAPPPDVNSSDTTLADKAPC